MLFDVVTLVGDDGFLRVGRSPAEYLALPQSGPKPRSTDVIPMVRGVATRKVPSELG
jgi:hypothetical protein